MNIQKILQYLEENLQEIPFSRYITEPDTPHLRILYNVPIRDTNFRFQCTLFYLQIQMDEITFTWGDGIRMVDIAVVKHYVTAYLRLIQTFLMVSSFNEESKIAKIDMQLSVANILQYNLPEIHLDLFLKEKEKGCLIIRHLISQKYWIPPSPEGYPLPDYPLLGDLFYYQSVSQGLMSISLDAFYDSCHTLVEKIRA
jgi:hypothetical protein